MFSIAQVPQQTSNLEVQVQLEIVLQAFKLNRKNPRRAVPPGRVYVLQSEDGLLELYSPGEVVSLSQLWGKPQCQVIELVEFPGSITLNVTQFLAAISCSEDDVASLRTSFNIRLRDPFTFLKHMSRDNWEEKAIRDNLHKKIDEDIKRRAEALLSSSVQLWSGDERQVYERIFSPLDEELRMFGLCLDTTVHAAEPPFLALRKYPANLHNIALQFAIAERTVRYLTAMGSKDLGNQIGLSKDLKTINAATEEEGLAFFLAVRQNQQEVDKIAAWLKGQNLQEAASFVENLYSTSGQWSAQETALSEQVILAAIRNPMLTVGEWLRESPGATQLTLFQRLRDRIAALPR